MLRVTLLNDQGDAAAGDSERIMKPFVKLRVTLLNAQGDAAKCSG